ncbi:MAG: phosphate-starvation-inducible PsiE family protein [Thermodesulfobacteriota bacterium]
MNASASKIFGFAVRAILSILLTILLVTLLFATVKTFFELKELFRHGNVHDVLKTAMINSLSILAILEVFRTGLAYFSVGRVKVTYIIDTVIVVVLTELMIFWFKEIDYMKILLVMAVVLSLIVARILTMRFSPVNFERRDEDD